MKIIGEDTLMSVRTALVEFILESLRQTYVEVICESVG